ncbi:MAG: Exonuclease RNase and polymerase [Candidatus Nomurabacteria bacterium]|jgi:DNA polymerase III epsilon subunit-like protein|nr:Exonuclease RNase and polymerase [Candidatus Nomurabacteria bacterium]
MIFPQPLAFIDVETTGFDSDTAEVIELGVVIAKLKDDELIVIDQLDLKIHPAHLETAEAAALRVNGYNEADWLFAVTLQDAMKIFAEKTKGAIFVAHNVTFDYSFIKEAFKKTGVENKMHYHKLDTITLAFAMLHTQDDMNKLSLKALTEYYGIENKKAHSAFADAYATYELFKKLMKLK